MPEDQNRDNTFVLFVNDKGDNEKRPDYKGKMTVGGREFVISGWKKKSRNGGASFLSGKVEPKKDNGRAGGYQKPRPNDGWSQGGGDDEGGEDEPF